MRKLALLLSFCLVVVLSTTPKPVNLSCTACMRRLDCPPCGGGCVKDCDGFGCCVCYCK